MSVCVRDDMHTGNGPEDARVLPLTAAAADGAAPGRGAATSLGTSIISTFLLIFVDYARLPTGGGYARHMHASVLTQAAPPPAAGAHGASSRLALPTTQHTQPVRLEPASASVTNLSRIEKNWAPFRVGRHVYLQQWLDDGTGRSVRVPRYLR